MDHLSVTKIEAATLCPMRFKYRFVDRLPELSSGVAVSGRVFHSVVESALRRRMAGAPLPSPEELDDLFLSVWDERFLEEEKSSSFVGWQWDEGDSPARAKEDYRAMVRLAALEILPTLKPRLVEHRFEIVLNGVPLVGYLDLVEEGAVIADWKTVGSISARQRGLSLQLMGYACALREILPEGRTPTTDAKKIFLVRNGTRPRFEVVRYSITEQHRKWFSEVAQAVWRMVQGGGYPPNTDGWWCSPKFCGYYSICQEGIR